MIACQTAGRFHEFEDKNYHLRVYGPNGFYREFKGNAEDPELHIDFAYQPALTNSKKLTGNVELIITNLSGKPQTIAITDHAYKTNNHKKIVPASGKTIWFWIFKKAIPGTISV